MRPKKAVQSWLRGLGVTPPAPQRCSSTRTPRASSSRQGRWPPGCRGSWSRTRCDGGSRPPPLPLEPLRPKWGPKSPRNPYFLSIPLRRFFGVCFFGCFFKKNMSKKRDFLCPPVFLQHNLLYRPLSAQSMPLHHIRQMGWCLLRTS